MPKENRLSTKSLQQTVVFPQINIVLHFAHNIQIILT